jgi:hypothetical protein
MKLANESLSAGIGQPTVSVLRRILATQPNAWRGLPGSHASGLEALWLERVGGAVPGELQALCREN